MPRPHRISRALIAALVVVLALGAVFWLKNVSSSRAADSSAQRNNVAPGAGASNPSSRPPTPSIASPTNRGGGTQHIAVGGPATQPAITPTQPPQNQTQLQPQKQTSNAPGSTGSTIRTPAPAPSPVPTTPFPAGTVLADARAKRDAGDLLGARKILNDALVSGRLLPADADGARKLIAEINRTVFFSPKRFENDEFGGTHTVKSGELLRTIAERNDVTWELLARLNGISDPRKLRAGQNIKVVKGPFNAIVTKSRFTLDIYLGPPGEPGSLYVATFPVGLGSDDSTPTGTWMVETHKKLKNPTYFSPRGEGVIDAGDPANPLGERWIGLVGIDGNAIGKESYGIHGTIEPDSIGKMASMGCIRMRNEDVELVFDMLTEGKSVVVVKD
jgi:LysM repeat protein